MRELSNTHWSLVLAAADSQSPDCARALAALCHSYWPPLFAFALRCGRSREDAEDLTQEFFARMLAQKTLTAADPERGRFRSFLFKSFENFLHNEADKVQAIKRGGGKRLFSIDRDNSRWLGVWEPAESLTPQRIFDRQWAECVLASVLSALRREYVESGREHLHEILNPLLTDDGPSRYVEAARELNMSEGAIRVAVHRMRKRYGALLRQEIGQTVSSPGEIEDELRAIFAAFAH